jgi:hypothetical protein
VQYVYVELPLNAPESIDAPGATLRLVVRRLPAASTPAPHRPGSRAPPHPPARLASRRPQGLGTAEPLLVGADGGVLLRGRHEDTLGSHLLMALGPAPRAAAGPADGAGGGGGGGGGAGPGPRAPPAGAAAGGERAPAQQQQAQRAAAAGPRYLCHLEKRLVFEPPVGGSG